MTMAAVWYVLCHASLGVIGRDLFTLTLPGTLACMGACAAIQAWPVWEVHRIAWPRFAAAVPAEVTDGARARLARGYWLRLGRLLVFRSSMCAILTLAIAALARG